MALTFGKLLKINFATGGCILGLLTREKYPLATPDSLALGRTDVTYTLEWNPAR